MGDDLLYFVIALDMGAVFALQSGDQALVHELQHMLVPGRFEDHVVHHGEESFAALGFAVELAEQRACAPAGEPAPGGAHDHLVHQQAQAVGVGLEHAGVVVELTDFFHDRGDLVADAFVQRGHVVVLVQAAQTDDQSDQRRGGIAQWVPGQTTHVELWVGQECLVADSDRFTVNVDGAGDFLVMP